MSAIVRLLFETLTVCVRSAKSTIGRYLTGANGDHRTFLILIRVVLVCSLANQLLTAGEPLPAPYAGQVSEQIARLKATSAWMPVNLIRYEAR